MHTQSLPVGDREDREDRKRNYPHNGHVRAQLLTMREAGWSNQKLAGKIGMNSSVVSQYLDATGCIYSGDVAAFERKALDVIQNEARRRASGVDTIDTSVSREIATAFEYIRKTNDCGLIVAESGDGKTRGVEPFVKANPTALLHQTCIWHRHENALQSFFFNSAPKTDWDNRTNRMDFAVSKFRGTDRLFIFDDAHKLPLRSLQLCMDFHDRTLCPVAFVGTFGLLEAVQKDPQVFRRIGLKWIVGTSRPKELIKHLIDSLVPGINGQYDELATLCEQVADNAGHFGAVHKQLKLAVEMRETSTKFKDWVSAFRAAHTKMCRDYKLA